MEDSTKNKFYLHRGFNLKKTPVKNHLLRQVMILLLIFTGLMEANAATYVVTTASDNAGGTNPAVNAGTGTLRQAIINANSNAGADIINFNIAGAGVQTLTMLANLPLITGPTTINGYSQTGTAQGAIGSRTILIQIDGGSQTTGGTRGASTNDGLFRFTGTADGSVVSGLSIYNTGDGNEPILVEPGVSGMSIWGNYIGVLASGVSPASSADYNGDDGIFVGLNGTATGTFTNIFIGSDGDGVNDANEGNVISNSAGSTGGDGIELGFIGSTYTFTNIKISGNYIGLQADGLTAAGNGLPTIGAGEAAGQTGIVMAGTALASSVLIGTNGDGTSDVLERNIISGNNGTGIGVVGGINNLKIDGNYIGTDKTGLIAVPNGKKANTGSYPGITLSTLVSGSSSIIGFDDATHATAVASVVRNIVSGNWTSGILVVDGVSGAVVRISGNYVGASLTGNVALGNGQGGGTLSGTGIDINNAQGVLIGTDADGDDDVLERNIITSAINSRGVYLRGATATTIVAGNYIGVGADGTTALGNSKEGIRIGSTTTISTNNRIGSNDDGTNDATEANIIANNGTDASVAASRSGVIVVSPAGSGSTGNRISRNSFYNNKGLPIDLNDNGMTLNDGVTTANTGNLSLDYPVITGFTFSGTTISVAGYVSTCNGNESTAGASIAGNKVIQFYKIADDGDQNGALTNGVCTRVVSHGEGVQYLGSITAIVNAFNTSFTLVSGASFAIGDKITAIAIDASGNTSEFGVLASQIQVSGNVYADADGLIDGTVDGTGTNGGAVNAILYNNTTNTVAAIMAVPATGIYGFGVNATPGNSFTVYLTTNTATVGSATIPVIALPTGYASTGENLGAAAGSDGTVNGILSLGPVNTTVDNANFGIERRPTGTAASAASQPNPGGTATVAIPSTVFNGTDVEDGGAYASNLSGRTVILNPATNGTLYYNGVAVSASTSFTNFNPALVSMDPTGTTSTALSTSFTYNVVDNAGIPSLNITVTVPVTAAARLISGTVWNDVNSDAVNSAEAFTNAGSIYANLVNFTTGAVIQSVLVDATTGAYSLGGAGSTAYNIVLTDGSRAVGTVLSSGSLPNDWANTGVNISGVSNSLNQTGVISVASGTGALANQNFGVKQITSLSQDPCAATTTQYDGLIGGWHNTLAKNSSGGYTTWGQYQQPGGYDGNDANGQLSPADVTPANGYNYTGDVILATLGTQGRESLSFLLTTTGLYAWGYDNIIIAGSITSNNASLGVPFQKIAVNSKADGLPTGVSPTDVKMMTANGSGLTILTNAGTVYTLSHFSNSWGDGTAPVRAAGTSAVWHQALTAAATPLTGVVVLRASGGGVFAITSGNDWYTWGINTYLGTAGSGPTARGYATLMTKPAAFTSLSDVKMIAITHSSHTSPFYLASYYVLHNTTKRIYVLGKNDEGQLGTGNTTDAQTWTNVVQTVSGSLPLENVNFISANDNDEFHPAAGAILTTGTLLLWGNNNEGMIGAPLATTNSNRPRVPDGFTVGTDIARYVEVGGHFTEYYKQGATQPCYTGHHIGGSAGNGTATDAQQIGFGCNLTLTAPLCPSYDATVVLLNVTGSVFNDANGLNATPVNTVDGPVTNAGGLNAVLVDAVTGNVVAVVAIGAGGTYSFDVAAGNYNVEITTNTATVGSAAPAVALPVGWVSTGENLGATVGNDGVVNGILPLGTISANVTNANLGIEQPPVAVADNSTGNVNGTAVIINPLTNDTDATPGTTDPTTVSLVPPVGSTTNTTDANGDITSVTVPGEGTWTVDPTTGAITFTPLVTFTGNPTAISYNVEDNAGKVSNDAAVTITYLSLVSISGNVWNDANGNAVNNTENPITAGVWVNLVDPATNDVMQSVQVDASGNYTFPGVAQSTSYQIILTNADATGNTNLTASTLPGTYVNTGTNLNGTASTANTTGIVTVNSGTTGLTAQNFGIEQLPTATPVTATTQQNPGGNGKVVVPTLHGTDPEDGTYNGTSLTNTIKIQDLPTNGTLYYNGVAVIAGQVISTYDPALLTLDPNDGVTSVTFTYSEVDAANQVSAAATVTMPFTTATSFACTNLAYQIAGASAGNNLYSYNLNTGVRTLVANLGAVNINAIGYNASDNNIWGVERIANQVVRVDATGALTRFSIANLPAIVNGGGTIGFTVGAISPNGYLYLYADNFATYYVVDVNASRSTYLQLVDPTASYALEAAPYGTSIGTPININDWVYNSATNKLIGVINSPGSNAYRVATIEPTTGAVSFSSSLISGSTFQSENTFGSIFYDGSGTLYAFGNVQGKYYRVDVVTNTATLLSTTSPSTFNDGASCTSAILSYPVSGNVFNDTNGLNPTPVNTIDGTGTNAGGLNAILYDNTTGAVAAMTTVNADGTYSFGATSGNDYSVYITTNTATVGQTAVPVVALPSGWVSTGENLGSGAGNDGLTDGILQLNIVNAAITEANFGIEQPPVATNDSSTGNVNGTAVIFNPLTNDTDATPGTTDPTTVSLVPPVGSTTNTTDANGDITSVTVPSEGTWTVDPTAGAITFTPLVTFTGNPTVISYNVEDNAGKVSNDATVTITYLSLVSISGNVWNDADGNAVNNTENPITAGVWVNLVDPATNDVIQSVQVDASGNYTFPGVAQSTSYQIILTNADATGNTNLTASTLPGTYVNTGTNLAGTASTANTTGIVTVNSGTTGLTAQNFGIEIPPVATADVSNNNVNGTPVTINPLTNDTDATPGTLDPTKVSLVPPVGSTTNTTDANGDITSVTVPGEGTWTVDPTTGVITFTPLVTFTGNPTVISYNVEDNAGKVSNDATVTVTYLSLVSISGNVWNDANGNAVNNTENPITAGVWVNLVDPATNDVMQSVQVDASGNYTFPGVAQSTNYQIILTNADATGNTNLTASTLPGTYVNTGTNLDGTASTANTTGIVTVNSGTTGLAAQNFGIEVPPVATNDSSPNNVNGTPVTISPLTNDTDADGTTDPTTVSLVPPVGSTTNTTDANGDITSVTIPGEGTWTVDPTTGAITFTPLVTFTGNPTVINYNVEDNAGKVSNDATVTITYLSLVSISGNVWEDANGNAVNNTENPITAGVWVNLVDPATNDVIQSVEVDASGNYTFPGVAQSTNYQIILTNADATGNTNLTASALPGTYVNTGTNLSGTANTANTTGIVTVNSGTTGLTAQNFGIEIPPVATADVSNNNVNGTPVTVTPLTNDTDADGTTDPTTVSLVAPVGSTTNTTDANGDITSVTVPGEGTWTVDPTTGAITFTPLVTFTGNPAVISYNVEDNAGKVSNDATVTVTYLSLVSISGNVWNDANGNAVNNTENPITAGVWVNLVDPATNDVIQSVQVDASGNYTFAGVAQSTNYQIILTNADATGNTNLTASTLPGTYVNTGTNLAGTANTGNTTGVVTVNSGTTGLTAQNFGIEIPPVATADVSNNNVNGTPVTVTPLTNDTDADGTTDPTTVSLVAPVGSTTNTTDANGDITSVTIPGEGTWTVDPTTGAITFTPLVTFTGNPTAISYNVEDNAGKVSNDATVTITYLSLVSISGNVWNDANGNAINNTENPITAGVWVNLVDPATNDVIQSVQVDGSGNYTFPGVAQSTSFQIILSSADQTGNTNLTASTIPAGYVNTGTNLAGTASTANTTGVITVNSGTTGLTAQNFGIEQPPVAANDSSLGNVNGTPVTISPLTNDTDADGTLDQAKVSLVALGTATGLVTDANGDITSMTIPGEGTWTVDPATGAITFTPLVTFTGNPAVISYNVEDNASKVSNNATVTITYLSLVSISGNVWDDANGNAVNNTESPITSGVWVNLVDPATNDVIQSVQVDASGNYTFTGVTQSTNYQIILTNADATGNTNLTASTIPTGYVNTGTNLAGTVNTTNTTGVITINSGTTGLTAQNFGIEQPPVAANDSSLGNVNGTAVTINPLTNDTDATPGTLDATKVSLVAPGTATGLVIDANGDITSMTIPGEGTWTVDPATGAITFAPLVTFTGNPAVISYNVEDNASKVSNNATVTITYLSLVSISGNIWDDANGNAVNNTENPITAGVWVNLVDPATNDVIQSVQVDGSGNYTFPGVAQSTNYQIILTNADATGNTNLTASTIPTGYVSTGTNLAGTASTANTTGVITVNSGTTGLTAQNFGIEQPPVATNDSSLGNVNGTPVTISPLTNDTDADGTTDPAKVSLIAPGTATGLVTDANGDITSMTIPGEGTWTVDPSTGAITFTPLVNFTGNPAVISYNVEDNASKVSNNATVTITYLSLVSISGNVWDDANGNAVNNTENPITAGVWANLVDPATNDVIQSVQVDGSGNYTFPGVAQSTSYQIILTNADATGNTNLTASTIPAGYVSTGTNLAGTASTANTTGLITVNSGTAGLINQNFGIEQPPVATNDSSLGNVNGTAVIVNLLSNDSDADGTPDPTTVSLVAPGTATGLVTDANGDITSMTIPGEGTWTVNGTTGAVTFSPWQALQETRR
ncbi:Ig-like domain-containing protein [Dyadobacter sp. NIV53]|uniref:Ig-like domain-containing protein n=1 Tax=Dyadobacter sp. NIV53 TaxID=2861765 RepID=UPI001C869926|nr:hypothetical protein [Dyadobacter sp. NIV53]